MHFHVIKIVQYFYDNEDDDDDFGCWCFVKEKAKKLIIIRRVNEGNVGQRTSPFIVPHFSLEFGMVAIGDALSGAASFVMELVKASIEIVTLIRFFDVQILNPGLGNIFFQIV